jgi:predicted ATPase/DNA-binding XRE family transcriptional regulator
MSESLGATRSRTTAFGAALRSMRLAAGLSQGALAERAGLSEKAVGALERGDRTTPRPATIVLLADAVGASPAERDQLLTAARAEKQPTDTGGASPAPRGLLVPPTPLLGRQQDIAAVSQLVSPSGGAARLLTLIGPGGVGKTRLACAAATGLAADFPEGIAFVDLAPVRDARLVPATIARALDVRESGGLSARELLLAYLSERRVLLVLDNFEHLLEAAPIIADLVSRCPCLAALVTSRAALRVRGERRFLVAPLATPSAEADPAGQDIGASPAVQLFVERARAVASDFALDGTNASAVAAICRRLDGLPLAIELAAAQAGLLGPEALLGRLEHCLPLLTRGAVDLPERQQTLHTTLAWSHDLLAPAAQVVFRRLAVFVGGWTLRAAEAVCADDALLAEHVLDQLQQLVESSLIRCPEESGDEPRFAMLETMREYAEELLVSSGEAERIRASHATFYSRLAEPPHAEQVAWPWVWAQTPEQMHQVFELLEPELANFHAALQWWATHARVAEGLRLAVAVNSLWSRLGQYAAGRHWLELMLDVADRTAAPNSFRAERAVALTEAGTLAGYQRDYQQARTFHHRSAELWRELNHVPNLAIALANLGLAEWLSGDAGQATVLLEEALERSRAANLPHTVAICLRDLGLIARAGGQLARAEALFREAAAQRLPPGWYRGYSLARSISCLGRIAYLQADVPRAAALLREALQIIRQARVTGQALADCLDWQAALETSQGELGRAARLFGAADNQWQQSGAKRYAPDEPAYAHDLAALRAAVDEETFASEWAAGSAMQLREAIAYAMREDPTADAGRSTAPA